MILSLKEILILFTVFQLIIFSVLLIARIKTLQSNLVFLCAFFLSLAINIANYFLILKSEYLINTPYINLFYLGSPFAFSYAPFFYLYLRAITTTKFRLGFKTLAHFIPFTLHFTYVIFLFTILPLNEKKEILLHGGLYSKTLYHALTIILHLQVLLYSLLSIWQIFNVRQKLKNLYSSVEKLNFTWICSMLAAILCIWLLDLSRFFTAYFSTALSNIVETTLFLGFVLFCYFFLYKALTFRLLIEENDLQAVSKKFSLSSSLRLKYKQRLIRFMMEHKPFLDPEINLVELAQQVGIPPRSLSEVIRVC